MIAKKENYVAHCECSPEKDCFSIIGMTRDKGYELTSEISTGKISKVYWDLRWLRFDKRMTLDRIWPFVEEEIKAGNLERVEINNGVLH